MRIAVTTGEPAGVGPEVALRAALASGLACDLIGDRALLRETSLRCGLPWPLPAPCDIVHEPLAVDARPGHPDARNAGYVLRLLDCAIQGCESGYWAAMATAPVHKAVINEAGIPFSGHTEYLAQATATPRVLMLLVAGTLRVALATTHLALRDVPQAVTGAQIGACLDLLDAGLRARFGLSAPSIAVLGLNPHAGEGGHMGREEIDIIAPAIAAARARSIDATGPLPADTAFVEPGAARWDAFLAMYHDQGLAPFKRASFGGGVNVTLGLPIVRTSADHGTALDIAGQGRADPGSMLAAIELAAKMGATAAALPGEGRAP